MPERIQRSRKPGWRMPEGAIYVGRGNGSVYGNPFPSDGDQIMWLGVALGFRGDAAGRRAAAVHLHRAWLLGEQPKPLPLPNRPDEWTLVFEGKRPDGQTIQVERTETEHVRGIAALASAMIHGPIAVPPVPDLSPLRGHDLACWCPIECPRCYGIGHLGPEHRTRLDPHPEGRSCDDCFGTGRAPCHADTLLEFANDGSGGTGDRAQQRTDHVRGDVPGHRLSGARQEPG